MRRRKTHINRNEPIKRFYLAPTKADTPNSYHHCNTKRDWHTFLNNHFSTKFSGRNIKFNHTISNAAFRIAGLEVKVGILLADAEQRLSDKQILSGAVLPSIVIDSVLSSYSILEGLGTLSHLATVPSNLFDNEMDEKKRKNKFSKGIKAATGEKHDKELKELKALRDRCIHQDCADLADDLDYANVFSAEAIKDQIGLVYKYLSALSSPENPLPDTNLNEFWHTTFKENYVSDKF